METKNSEWKRVIFSKPWRGTENREYRKCSKNDIISHLTSLEDDFKYYYSDIRNKSCEWKVISNPFTTDVKDVKNDIQEEFLDLQCDSFAKDDFDILFLDKFWIKYLPVYPKLCQHALKVIFLYVSTYLCESTFSALTAMKTKYRNKLNVEDDLRCALSSTAPRIEHLVVKKQCQSSPWFRLKIV